MVAQGANGYGEWICSDPVRDLRAALEQSSEAAQIAVTRVQKCQTEMWGQNLASLYGIAMAAGWEPIARPIFIADGWDLPVILMDETENAFGGAYSPGPG